MTNVSMRRLEKTAGWLVLVLCLGVPLHAEESVGEPATLETPATSETNDAVSSLQGEIARCQAQTTAQAAQLDQLRGETETALTQVRTQAAAELQQTRQATQDMLERVRAEAGAEREHTLAQFQAEVHATAAEQQAIQANLTTQLNEALDRANRAEQRISELETQNQQLAGHLVQAEGGTITPQAAQEQAQAVYQRYRTLLEHHTPHRQHDTKVAAEIARVAGELTAAQSLVVRATGAKGLQIVRRGDTLSAVARLVFGESHQWKTLQEANRHLLGDNVNLLEGMPLIVP